MAKKNDKAKKEKAQKKKGNGCLFGMILLIILLMLLIYLLKHFGLGFFGNSNSKEKGKGSGSSSSVSDNVDKDTNEDENAEKIVEITAWGSGQYRYDDGKIELEDFINTVKEMTGRITVHISDDSSTANTMKELVDALKEAGIAYTEPSEAENTTVS